MANKLPSILLVEDEEIAAFLATEILSSDYDVHRVVNGEEALAFVAEQVPDLVLLDVLMPGMSGYEVCQALRSKPNGSDLPILFLSGRISEEDRLAGYEAGGDDYLTKPVVAGELRSKVKLAINHYAERRRLKSDVYSAFSTAMIAMSSATELETVLQFLRASSKCKDYAALCQALLNVTTAYGLDAMVQIRGQQGEASFTAKGPCSPLEESVLHIMSGQGRSFKYHSYTSFSYAHVTLIVKNMPDDTTDEETASPATATDRPNDYQTRIRNLSQVKNPKQLLDMLSEESHARVSVLDEQLALTQTIASTKAMLHDLQHSHQQQQDRVDEILQIARAKLEKLIQTLDFTELQEKELIALVQQTAESIYAFHNQDPTADARMQQLLQQLDKSCLS